ncbi:MAG: hypothetical protein NT031_04020 [Planctomycetota bacterium]|nr:hypothetical protein [Planctomycetota bacterium]
METSPDPCGQTRDGRKGTDGLRAAGGSNVPVMRLGVLLAALFVLIYIVPLDARPMAVPDEARYGEIAREMVASGDWIVPRLDGIRFFGKPPLGYWAIAASIEAFG